MQISIDTSALHNLEALAADIDRATEAGLDAVAEAGEAQKLEAIEETYARPIPTGKNGAPKWTRTGNWRDNQTTESSEGERSLVTRGPAEDYEPRLAVLPISPDGVNRRNAAAERTAEWLEQNAQGIFERAVEDVLNR